MKHYTSIDDIPVYNWRKINETNDLRWMFPGGKGKTTPAVATAFEKIRDEFIDTFGISDDYRRLLEIKVSIEIWSVRIALEQDNSHVNFIRRLEVERDEILKRIEGNKNSFFDTKVMVEQFMGFRINEKEISVREFYSYIERLKQQKRAA